jgi:hypothetical protein
MTQKETREIVAEYERHGFRIEKNKHIKVYDGPRLVTVLSGSRCGGWGSQNAKVSLKLLVRQRQAVAA